MQLYDRGIRRRLAPMLGGQPQLELAYSVMFSLPGTPVIRYGDLFGLRAMRTHVKGFDTTLMRPRFHNVWLEK